MLGMLRKAGISSNIMYTMGFGSIGMAVATWAISMTKEEAGLDRADRWGIFIGQWAPTFFALGAALRMEEQWGSTAPHEKMEEAKDKARQAMPVS